MAAISDIPAAIRIAKSVMENKSEQISFIHQTLLALLNIADIAESTVGSYGIQHDNAPWILGEEEDSSILKLHRQRQNLQTGVCNVSQAIAPVLSSAVMPGTNLESLSHSDVMTQTCASVLHAAVASLEELCSRDWGWISETSRQEGLSKHASKAEDPFAGDCHAVGRESCTCALEQLRALKDRCWHLTEMEEEVGKRVEGSMLRHVDDGGGSAAADDRVFRRTGGRDLDECIWRIEERVRGYEESIAQFLGEMRDWKSERWIKTLEENHRLLTTSRWVEKLMEVSLEFPERHSSAATAAERQNHFRLLKVLSQCFAALPLPLQCTLFQWLWEQPKGPSLLVDSRVVNVQQELTLVFNRLVTGSANSHVIEIAREFIYMALHNPRDTLQRTLQEALSNPEAASMIVKALQCIPFLLEVEVDGRPCFLGELTDLIGSLATRELSSTEELHLLKFLALLMEPYRSPCHPELPATFPPLVSPYKMADSCVWPFVCRTAHPLASTAEPRMFSHQLPVETKQTPAAPMHLVLRVLDAVLAASRQCRGEERGRSTFEAGVSFSAVLCLCRIIGDCEAAGAGRIAVKELAVGVLQEFAELIKEAGELSSCLEWLLEQTNEMDWTIRLRVNALFLDVSPLCSKNISEMVQEITGSFADHAGSDAGSDEHGHCGPVPMYIMWSCSMLAFFQACRISSQVSDLLINNLPLDILSSTPSSRRDLYRSVCMSLGQVLPHSTTAEWLTVLRAIDQLLDRGILHVQYTARFLTAVPMLDLTDYKRHLYLSQVLTSMIQLLGNTSMSDSLIVLPWQHIIKNYANVMKVVLEMAMEVASSSSSSSSPSSPSSSSDASSAMIVLIGQFFCQSCEAAQCVPAGDGEQLFVWCLELLLRLEELASNRGNEGATAVQEDIMLQELRMMTCQTESLLHEEQRDTLRHKLHSLSFLVR